MRHKARVVVLLVLLVGVLCTGIALGRLLGAQIDTGTGSLSRLDVGRIYLRMAAGQPRVCQQAYLLGVSVGLILAPANAMEDAAKGRIRWQQAPSRAWELYVGYLEGVFHNPHPYKCGLPRPQDWTIDMPSP